MDDLTDDDPFLDPVYAVVLDALVSSGDDPRARIAFFRRPLAVAQKVAKERGVMAVNAVIRAIRQHNGADPQRR